jgi:hypothetical protein
MVGDLKNSIEKSFRETVSAINGQTTHIKERINQVES